MQFFNDHSPVMSFSLICSPMLVAVLCLKPREGFRGQDCGFGSICPSAHSSRSFNQGFLSPFDPLNVAVYEADWVWYCFGVGLFVFAFDGQGWA